MPSIHKVEEALEEIRSGRMVILVDDEDRENEGDLCMAAEKVTPKAINFMATHGRGLICLTLTPKRMAYLQIPPMTNQNQSPLNTAFHVSIEARQGVTTGISAQDRAHTIVTAIDPKTTPDDLVQPGHVFPLKARPGGVLVRTGQTEGSVDLARLAGLAPAGAICEIMKEDGTMARLADLEDFAQTHGLKIVTIADLIKYRLQKERFVHRVAEATVPTAHAGEWKAIVYNNDIDQLEHVALVKGVCDAETPTLVRMHSECLTGDVFHSLRCDCGDQLRTAMVLIEQAGSGAVVYLRQEGRGIGLANKIKAYALQDGGKDTVEANESLGFKPDLRDYGLGAQILLDLGLRKIKVLTNNPKKIVGVDGYGLEVVDRVPIEMEPRSENIRYLRAKQQKLGHLLSLAEDDG